jgi:SPP1 gp7 family putative phage head morphogenesis protein
MPKELKEKLQKQVEPVLTDFYNNKGKMDENRLFATTGKALADLVKDSYGKITPDFNTPDILMLHQLNSNVWQFSAAKNFKELDDLSRALVDKNGNLREFAQFKEAANKICEKYNETWLRTEYNFAIASSQNAARWTELANETDFTPMLMYKTVGDSAVRPEHQALDGIVAPVDDKFWDINCPPNGWGCRCEVIPAVNRTVTPKENIPNIPIPQMFRTNLAKTGLIFPKNHPYYNGIPKSELRKSIAYLPPKNTYQSYIIGDHEIDVHPLHGEAELEKNLNVVNALLAADERAKVKLLPIIDINSKNDLKMIEAKKKFYPKKYMDKYLIKNADAIYNNNVVEFEVPEKATPNAIKNAIKNGKKQADFVIVLVPDKMTMQEAERYAKGQIKHYENKEELTIWLLKDKEKRVFITKPKSK